MARRRGGSVRRRAARAGRPSRPVHPRRGRSRGFRPGAPRLRPGSSLGDGRAAARPGGGSVGRSALVFDLRGWNRVHGAGGNGPSGTRYSAAPLAERAARRLPARRLDRRPPTAARDERRPLPRVDTAGRVLQQGLHLHAARVRLAGVVARARGAVPDRRCPRLHAGSASSLLRVHPRDERASGLLQRLGIAAALARGRPGPRRPLPHRATGGLAAAWADRCPRRLRARLRAVRDRPLRAAGLGVLRLDGGGRTDGAPRRADAGTRR